MMIFAGKNRSTHLKHSAPLDADFKFFLLLLISLITVGRKCTLTHH